MVDDAIWSTVAFYPMTGGLIGAILAAVAEFADYLWYQGRKPPRKKVARIHMGVNVCALIIFAVNFWLRYGHDATTTPTLTLSAIGVALVLASSALGGQMMFVYRVGVQGRE